MFIGVQNPVYRVLECVYVGANTRSFKYRRNFLIRLTWLKEQF